MLFEIGNEDITKYIVDESYAVEEKKDFKEWIDGNFVKHRDYYEPKIIGSMDILCDVTALTKEHLINLIRRNTVNDKLSISAYINNTGMIETAEVFYELTLSEAKGKDAVNVYTLTIEEA